MPSESRNFFCILAVLLLISVARAIEVTPNSLCSPLCIDNIGKDPSVDRSSLTLASYVPCDDWEIVGSDSTIRGRKWKDCLSCETTSNATDAKTGQNDVYWLLFNLKFSLDWCVFGFPDNSNISLANEQCSEVCAGRNNSAKIAMTDRMLEADQKLQYLYCDGPDIENILDDCATCLDKVPNAKALRHYAEGMKEGCVQKPKVGETLKIDFDLFPTAATRVASTSSPARTETETGIVTLTFATPSPSPSSPVAVSASSASVVVASSHDQAVRVGVGVGVGVGGALVIAGVAIWLIHGRRRSAPLKQFELDARAPGGRQSHAGIEPKPNRDQAPLELGQPDPVEADNGRSNEVPVEADDGRPKEVPMLDSSIVAKSLSTGTFTSDGGAGGGSGCESEDPSWASTPRRSRGSRLSVARMLGIKPAMPAKD